MSLSANEVVGMWEQAARKGWVNPQHETELCCLDSRAEKVQTEQQAAPTFHRSCLPKYRISVSDGKKEKKKKSIHPAVSAASAHSLRVSNQAAPSL